jgi:hypothetical protein
LLIDPLSFSPWDAKVNELVLQVVNKIVGRGLTVSESNIVEIRCHAWEIRKLRALNRFMVVIERLVLSGYER